MSVRMACEAGRVLIAFVNLGPYHLARIRALEEFYSVTVLEYASQQALYGWDTTGADVQWERVVLSSGEYRDASRLKLAWRALVAVYSRRYSFALIPGYADWLTLFITILLRIKGVGLILMSESNRYDHPRSRGKEWLKSVWVRSMFSGALVGGESHKEYVAELGVAPSDIEKGYDCVDNEYFDDVFRLKEKVQVERTPRRFGFVGRLADEKNIGLLLDAFEEFLRLGGDGELWIVGRGPEEGRLRERVVQGEIFKRVVHLLGYACYGELRSIYAQLDFLVLPSIREPWGLVVNEAMASGVVPIVSDRCGAGRELVQKEVNGFVFCHSSPSELTSLLLRLSAIGDDELLRLRAAAKDVICRYGPEQFAAGVRALEERVVR